MLPDNVKSEIDISFLLDMYVHFDIQNTGLNNRTLGDILINCISRNDIQDETCKKMYDYLCQAIQKNDTLRNAVLISQSKCEGYSTHDLFACSFRTEDGSTYVCYRGTGDGKWPDNAEAMTRVDSRMQRSASSYYETVIQKNGVPQGGRVIVAGHSKGGNLAQYTTMTSKHKDQIDGCYSFDGQGMSHKAIDEFISQNGEEEYNRQRNKIYSVCGENDFVNVQGISVIPPDHKYIIKTPRSKSIGDFHSMYYMANEQYDGFNWSYDENGVKSEQPGEVAIFAEKLDNELREKLSPEEYDACCVSAMVLVELFLPYKGYLGGVYKGGTGDLVTASPTDFLTFLVDGLPNVLSTLLKTEEGRNLLKKKLYDSILEVYQKSGIVGVYLYIFTLEIIIVAAVVLYVNVFKEAFELLSIIDQVLDYFPWLKGFVNEVIHGMISIAVDTIQGIKDWYDKNLNQGFIAATNQPYFRVDTELLGQYASALARLIERVKTLDRNMNDLYGAVRLIDLGNVLSANYLVGGSGRLRKCQRYLENTKLDFETVEKYIHDIMTF